MSAIVSLDQLCELVVDCEHKTAPLAKEGYPSIRTPNVGRGRLLLERVNRVSKETYDAWTRRAKPRANDLIIAREAPVGNVAIIPEGVEVVLGQRTVLVRPDPQKVEPRFLCYFLLGDYAQARFHATSSGATVPHLNMKDIRGLLIPELPPIETQRRIASILGAFDDLIVANRRRVALLEEMARTLFDEWFVRFRFPGHKDVPLVETPDGPLPEGWRQAPISEAFILHRGRSYRSSELADEGGMPFVNLKCIQRDGGFRTSGIKRYTGDYKASHQVVRGDIVMAVTDMTQERRIVGRVGRIPLLDEPSAVISMDLVKVEPRSGVGGAFLYCWLRHSGFGLKAAQHANGANVLHLSPKAIVDLPISLPDAATQSAFGNAVSPLFELAEVLEVAEQRLAASRDLLLPRLISGELSIRCAERQLENAA